MNEEEFEIILELRNLPFIKIRRKKTKKKYEMIIIPYILNTETNEKTPINLRGDN